MTSLLSFHDLRAGISRELTSHGSAVRSVAFDPKGEVAVTGGYGGIVRVGPETDYRVEVGPFPGWETVPTW